ncbi:type I secretion protein, partial [Mesorhizobium sp. B2-4-15]|uniref:VCBS domain-containing protein n=1 Tax=Mesorhizobium sp. B2-4-15 TaxID=2589934 RepID=UPI00116D3253
FTVTIADGHGGTVDQLVTITITGTDEDPTISAADATGAVTEDTDVVLGNLSTTGTITFDDVDLIDTHTVSAAPAATNTLGGTLTPVVSDTATGAGNGTVTWTYTVADDATDYLAQGQTATETFTVTIADGHGGTVDQLVTITITGTDDSPVANADTGAVLEDATLTVSAANGVIRGTTGGSVADSDVDNANNTLVVSGVVAGTGAVTQGLGVGSSLSGTYGHLTLNADGSYNYVADNANSLAAGVTAVDTFTYTDKDPFNAVSNTTTLMISVTGTNDNPTVTAGAQSAQLVEAGVGTAGTASASIALTKGDVDAGDAAVYDGTALTSNGWATSNGGATYTKTGTYGIATL